MSEMWKRMNLSELTGAYGEDRDWIWKYDNIRDAYDNCPNPYWILWLHDKLEIEVPNSLMRFWGCDCIRFTPFVDGKRGWDLLDDSARQTILRAEYYAYGEASESNLCNALYHAVLHRLHNIGYPADDTAKYFTMKATIDVVRPDKEIRNSACNAAALMVNAAMSLVKDNYKSRDTIGAACLVIQAQLLRDFLNDPFR